MMKKGTYQEIRNELPEEVRKVLDHVVPPTASVGLHMVELDVRDNCSDMGCKSCDSCPIDKHIAVSISEYVDCIDVELGEITHEIDYLGYVTPENRSRVASSISQIKNAAERALKALEGGA